MPRLALVPDLRLVFDPSMSETQLSNNAFFNISDDLNAVNSILENAESEFWQRVDEAFRLDERRRYEVHRLPISGHQAYRNAFSKVGTTYRLGKQELTLEHTGVIPFDPNTSPDIIEVSPDGMDDWTDITSDEGDDWKLVDPSDGVLVLDIDRAFRGGNLDFESTVNYVYVRVKYRYGARGGDIRVGGQTTLDGSGTILQGSDNTPNTISVADAARLPPAPAQLLIIPTDDDANAEYVRVSNVDTSNDEITVETRGDRLTDAVSHNTGEIVHYAPPYVRTAVAKKAAIDMTLNDQYSEWLPDTEIPLDAPRKIDEWRNDWQTAIDLLS